MRTTMVTVVMEMKMMLMMLINTWQSKEQFCHCLVALSCSLHCPLCDDLDGHMDDPVDGLLGQGDDLGVGEN